MRFQFYDAALEDVPKLSVDGTVPNSIHFSHWEGNETPAQLRADTSTEIALNLVGSPHPNQFTQGIELVTNNHFDTDGVLSVWTVLTGARALEFSEPLIAAAEAGDFAEFRNDNGVRASIVIQGADQAGANSDTVSPLARQLAGANHLDDARCYDLVLPQVEDVLTQVDRYEPLWRDGWSQIERAFESFEARNSRVREYLDARLSLVTLAPEIFSPAGFNPKKHAAPFTAISRYARGHIFLIASELTGGWSYRIDYPYYSWAETIVRPRIPRQDLTPVMEHLNELESSRRGSWQADRTEMTSAVKFLGPEGLLASSNLAPDQVAEIVSAHLARQTEGTAAAPGA